MSNIILPEDIKYILEYEDCSKFNIEKFFLLEDVKNLLRLVQDKKEEADLLHKLGRESFNSTLLYGEPGTGKTFSAKYIAYKLGLDFFYVNYAKLMSSGMGETGKNLCKIFEFICDKDCVFMLDEIDYIAVRRDTVSGNNATELTQLTMTLMQELDYLRKERSNVVLMAATNRDDRLDEALMSRFANKYAVKQINIYEKEKFIKKAIKAINKQAKDNFIPEIKLDEGNLHYYCTHTSEVTIRGIDQDIDTSLSNWIANGMKDFELIHIESGLQAI